MRRLNQDRARAAAAGLAGMELLLWRYTELTLLIYGEELQREHQPAAAGVRLERRKS